MGSADFCISIHALRVEGDNQNDKLHELHQISIHALRVEGDLATPIETPLPPAISIHALRVEGDHLFSDCSLSIRISIHALRVEGDHLFSDCSLSIRISIHALRVEGDTEHFNIAIFVAVQFLSTPSGWRATSPNPVSSLTVPISIHALRVEGDSCGSIVSIPPPKYFYPRPPGGGRLLNL